MAAPGFEYFTSTDSGAPGLWGAAGRMAAVLDWIFVTKGGWDIEFTGTNLRAYRSQTGNRFRLRLDDTQTRYARLRAYRAMTAISTGTNQFPTNTQASNINTWGVAKRVTADTNPVRYWGIRTNRYLIMIIEYALESVDGVNYREVLVWGDVPTLCEADAHSTILVCTPAADSFSNTFEVQFFAPQVSYTGFTAPMYAAISGSPDGSVLSPAVGMVAPWPFTVSAGTSESTIAKSGRMQWADPLIYSTNTQAGNDGNYPRSRIPNLHMLWGGTRTAENANTPIVDLAETTFGGRTFKCFMSITNSADSYYTPAILLEISDTDGAL